VDNSRARKTSFCVLESNAPGPRSAASGLMTTHGAAIAGRLE
jgi:hypothetical protein